MRHLTRTRTLTAVSGVGLAVLLAACGGDDAAAPQDTADGAAAPAAEEVDAEHNDVDVEFAQGMIPHHQQAVDMSELAVDNAGSDEVRALAAEIAGAQEPEIQQMRAFLDAWGAEQPAEGHGMDHSAMDHGSMSGGMAGMMSPEEMADLEAARGADFDTMFLTMMIRHHEGAVEMAEVELADGANPQARELAQVIIDTQEAEIAEMTDLLGS